jgi:hypothetical protein
LIDSGVRVAAVVNRMPLRSAPVVESEKQVFPGADTEQEPATFSE